MALLTPSGQKSAKKNKGKNVKKSILMMPQRYDDSSDSDFPCDNMSESEEDT